nr:protein SIEVE ELEMENT OCCLUSION B-like [Ipomoea trifida]
MSNQVLSLSTSMISQNHAIDIEEAIIVEHVKATHDPRGEMDVDASSILNFVDDIFNSGSNTCIHGTLAKVVMMLASFAIIYGKLVLSEQMSCSNRKNLKDTSIKSALDLVKLMVQLKHSSPMIVANYWIARFVVAYTRLCILDPE